MRFERIGPLGFLNWFHDDWLVTRLAMRLFFLATIIVLAVTPLVYGWVNPNPVSFLSNLGWGILGITGPIAIFFLLLGFGRGTRSVFIAGWSISQRQCEGTEPEFKLQLRRRNFRASPPRSPSRQVLSGKFSLAAG
ncbi:MAG: hypothetical protein WA172_01630 [Terriglobales bacterium]